MELEEVIMKTILVKHAETSYTSHISDLLLNVAFNYINLAL